MTAFEMIPLLILSIGTFAVVVTSGRYAMAEEKKSDGSPFDLMVLKSVGGVAGAFLVASLIPFVTHA